tara:strand:+ start:92 stop:511 length:420 start_codon:yes stop_codon:yes gene_type:complete
MLRLLHITIINFLILGTINSQSLVEPDTLGSDVHTNDSTELAIPSDEYSKQLLSVRSSDCFCSDKVLFKITIEMDGAISNINLLKGTNTCWDEVLREALRKSSPWVPAKKNGIAIKSNMIIPIYYGTVIRYPCSELKKK